MLSFSGINANIYDIHYVQSKGHNSFQSCWISVSTNTLVCTVEGKLLKRLLKTISQCLQSSNNNVICWLLF